MNARNIFVLTSVADLPTVSEFVRAANHRNHLRTLFVREDDNAQFLPQMLYEAKLKSSRNILVHSTKDVPKRVLTAWSLGCPNQLIADAQVVGEELFVMACDHTLFRVGFAEMPALERIPSQQRSSFTISSEGSYMHWPEVDVHIDLDAIRYVKDETWREKKDQEKLMYDLRFGEAVAALRKQYGLKQADIRRLSERHVRRIEKGERTKIDTLAILARNHGLSLKEYLDKIAEMLSPKEETMADRAGSQSPIQPIRFVKTKGSPVTVGRRDKEERIREAMIDLQLAIDGCGVQPPSRFVDLVASLARHCSIFLRKMVLNDDRNQRLLDDDFCRMVGLGFDRIRGISGERRTLTLVPVDIHGGYTKITKKDEETGEPEVAHIIPVGPPAA